MPTFSRGEVGSCSVKYECLSSFRGSWSGRKLSKGGEIQGFLFKKIRKGGYRNDRIKG